MYFSFKNQPSDFIVSEILPFELSGNWDFFYIFFEKEKLNTMEIVLWICKNMKLKREQLGIAGLKDKEGITKQRISISKKNLKIYWGEQIFSTFLKEKIKILKSWRHDEPLAIGKNKGNQFEIRLRAKEKLPNELKTTLETKLEQYKTAPFPNAFWIQRFGKGNKNFKKASKLFEKGLIDWKLNYEVKFKLQAFWSMRFNELVMKRWNEQAFLLEGDIMVNGRNAFWTSVANYFDNKLQHFDYWKLKEQSENNSFLEAKEVLRTSDFKPEYRFPTGAVLGTEQLLCQKWTEARKYDDRQIMTSWFEKFGNQISKTYKLYGFRRPLRTKARDLEWKREDRDLILKFFLPTGSYASVFLSTLLEGIDPKGMISNGLIIPLISQA